MPPKVQLTFLDERPYAAALDGLKARGTFAAARFNYRDKSGRAGLGTGRASCTRDNSR